jgi:hemoglobin/transferrin/lactoferrin receptor protein
MQQEKFRLSRLALAVCACLGGISNTSATPTGVLEQVIVTASRTQERIFDSPASLSVITAEEISRSIAPNLAEVMRDIPGVQVTDSGQPGLGRIRIRGEESRRTAILINSQEVTDHYEVGTPLTLNPALVERIELIRGSGAVLYGSRALSGVVNFVTKKGGTEPVQATVSGSYNQATNGYNTLASVYGNVSGLEYRLAWSESDHEERKTPAGTMENTAYENENLYLYVGKNFSGHRVDYTYEDYQSSSDVFVEDEVKTSFPLTDFYLQTPQRDRRKHGLFYEWDVDNSWLKNLSANAFTQSSKRHFYTYSETVWYARDINSYSDLDTLGSLLQIDLQPLGNDHDIIAGIQYSHDEVDQTRHVDTLSWTPIAETGIEIIEDKANIETWAWFVQDQWRINNAFTLTGGLRQYFVEAELSDTNRESLTPGDIGSDDKIIAALGLVWELSDSLRLRSNISEGYVYPSLTQLATGAYAGSSYVNPNPDLKPETSINYEVGLRMQGDAFTVDLSAFYTESEDYIHHLPCAAQDNCPGSRDRYYTNVGESDAQGIELFLSYLPQATNLEPYANLTWMERRNHYEDFSTSKTGVPSLRGRTGLRWQGELVNIPGIWTDLYLRGESSSQSKEPGSSRNDLEDKDSWITVNFASGITFGERDQYQLGLELLNLTDKEYIASSENLYGAERSAAVKFTLDI